jgi:hypothetical protein
MNESTPESLFVAKRLVICLDLDYSLCHMTVKKKNDINSQAYGKNEDKFSFTFSTSNEIISVEAKVALLGDNS